jgi:hypothetical protein
MQGKWIYLGRLTVPAAPIATGSSQALSGGDSLTGLKDWTLSKIAVDVRTVGTMTSTATMQLRTGNDVAVTAAMSPTTNPQTEGTVVTKHEKMDASDVAAAFDVVVAGSGASVDSGSWDFWGEFLPPVV